MGYWPSDPRGWSWIQGQTRQVVMGVCPAGACWARILRLLSPWHFPGITWLLLSPEGDTDSELAPRGLCQGPLQPPHHPHGLSNVVQLSEAARVARLTVALQGWLEHRDGNAEVQVRVGGPRVIVPGVAGDDAY